MKLDLQFTARPLEDIGCDTVIAFVFQGPAVTDPGVSGLDFKTSGALTTLAKKGFWTGAQGETLLVPSQGMIRARKILLKGLGPDHDYGIELFSDMVQEIGSTLERMTVNDIGIRIPVQEGSGSECLVYIETACSHLADFFLARHKEDDFQLKIVVNVDEGFSVDLESLIRQLKEHFKSRLDYTIVYDRGDILDS